MSGCASALSAPRGALARVACPRPGVLRRERGLPLPRAGVRRAPVRTRRAARRRLAPDRERGRDLRALATAVARGPRRLEARPGEPCSRSALVFALMNVCFYVAIDRLPLGTVAAIEFLPVILLAALGARTGRNAAALALAVLGRLPADRRRARGRAGRARVRLRNAALFAALHRARPPPLASAGIGGIDGLAAAMLVAAVCVTPLAGSSARPGAASTPSPLAAGIGVGIASSVVPYVFDQLAMARLAARHVLAPGVAAARHGDVIGVLVLSQLPSWVEVGGVALVVTPWRFTASRRPANGEHHTSQQTVLLREPIVPCSAVAVFEADDVVQMRRRDLDDERVLERGHAMDGARRERKRCRRAPTSTISSSPPTCRARACARLRGRATTRPSPRGTGGSAPLRRG